MARYFGFTKDEVRMLTERHGMDFDDLEKWYDNYQIGSEPSMFNPNSMMQAIDNQWCETVLIHLGYLSYDRRKKECYIPNREVAGEMVNAVKRNNWTPVVDALEQSKALLRTTLDGGCEAVAHGVDAAHDEHTSILSYNNENSLACML